jgi:hypothetical protein
MKRSGSSLRDERNEGSERSQQLAAALAQVSDPEFLERVLHMKSALDEFGGEFRVQALRHKYDPVGNRLEDMTLDGEYYTDAYMTHYSHYAKDAPQEPNDELKDLHAQGEDKVDAILAAVEENRQTEKLSVVEPA